MRELLLTRIQLTGGCSSHLENKSCGQIAQQHDTKHDTQLADGRHKAKLPGGHELEIDNRYKCT